MTAFTANFPSKFLSFRISMHFYCFVCVYILVLCEESHSTSLLERRPDFQMQTMNSEPQQSLLASRPPLCLPLPLPSGMFLLFLKLSFQEDAGGISEASLYFSHLAIILYHHCRSYKQQFSPQSSATAFTILFEHLLHKNQY